MGSVEEVGLRCLSISKIPIVGPLMTNIQSSQLSLISSESHSFRVSLTHFE